MYIDKILLDIVAIEHGFQHILDRAEKIFSTHSKELYVVKQKCTTANVVFYSDISLFYYQKFFC